MQRMIQTIGERWHKAELNPLVVAEAYLTSYKSEIEQRRFRPSWLYAGSAADRIERAKVEEREIAIRNGMHADGVSNEAQAIAIELETGHSYTRRLLRTAGVPLHDMQAISAWLCLRLGNVPAVSAYVLSGGHPEVTRLYSEELKDALSYRPALMAFLNTQRIDTQPLYTLINERS